MNKTNQSSNTSNIFKNFKRKLPGTGANPSDKSNEKLNLDHDVNVRNYETPYYSPDQTNILFLSKRGMSRAPLAREIMRNLLHFSDHFGSIRPSARGVSEAYDFCPFDKRMIQAAKKYGYDLQGNSRRVNMPELSSANLIVPLDLASEDYTKSMKFYIHGQVFSIGKFLNSGHSSYIADPFERDELWDIQARYDDIIRTTQTGCSKLLSFLPSLLA